MPAMTLNTVSAQRRVSAVKRKSSIPVTEETVQERLGLRRRDSTVRKAAIFEALGKWEDDEEIDFTKPLPQVATNLRRKSFDDGPLVIDFEEEDDATKQSRAKSADSIRQKSSASTPPLVPKPKLSKKELKEVESTPSPSSSSRRASTPTPKKSPLAAAAATSPKRASVPVKESSSRTLDSSSRSSTKKKSSSRKLKKASSRSVVKEKITPTNLDQMLGEVDDSKKAQTSGSTENSGSATSNSMNNANSTHSAPSKLPPNRAKRRTSATKGPKSSSKSMVNGRKPRRSKSNDLDGFAESSTKVKKGSKRRSKSADHDVEDFGPDIMVEVKSEKSKKVKGRTKRRSIKRTAVPANDAENDEEIVPVQNKPQDRRASLAGTKKRAHSAGPRARNSTAGEEEEDIVKPSLPARAASMMLNRDNTRRGKANSLMDLVQYSAEEIHSTSYFASNHVLVNRERMKRGLRPLTRNIAMDTLARESAEAMAKSTGTAPLRTTYVGNVLRGESIRAVHRAVMLNKQGRERANMLNPYFQDFGVGTAKGKDGMLYVCQLFSERLELSCTNLATDEGKTE